MCDSCGCDSGNSVTISKPGAEHEHHHHHHHHKSRTVKMESDVLARNQDLAAANRRYFEEHDILALNLVSSPGSGKTTILERTISELAGKFPLAVIEGDQQTLRDAERIRATGADVVQVNTGAGCHLDSSMVEKALGELHLHGNSVLFIENVGNLVCPAMFDLGEAAKVVIISVTEGEDKPQKYPHMFRAASLCLINKTDLLPYLDFDLGQFRDLASQVNPELNFIEMSARTGEGMENWYTWLEDHLKS